MKKFCGRVEAMNLQILMHILTKCSTGIRILLLHDAKNTYQTINIIVVSWCFISVRSGLFFSSRYFLDTISCVGFCWCGFPCFRPAIPLFRGRVKIWVKFWSSSESSKKGKDVVLQSHVKQGPLDVKPASLLREKIWLQFAQITQGSEKNLDERPNH